VTQILLHDATIITPDAPTGDLTAAPTPVVAVRVLYHHSLVLAGGRVTELGPSRDFEARRQAGAFATVVPGTRRAIVPGLVNTHHHLYQSLTRCLPAAQNVPLFDWLRVLYTHWRQVDYRAVHLAAQVSIAELLLHGCTTTSDHFYLFPPQSDVRLEAVLAAAAELGIRMHVCRGSMSLGQSRGGLPPDDCVERDADVLADCERVLDAYHDPAPYALRRIDLAPCSPFNVTRELLRDTRALARARGVLLHTHLAETLDEQAYCLDRFGCRPVQYLADLDWLGPDVYLAHCVWLDDAELELLARTRTAVSLCPTSNLRLGSGLPRLADLRARGVRLGLGVDGSSSNDGGNLLAEAKQALLVGRMPPVLTQSSAPWLSAAEALWLATRGGAACLHRAELGHLHPGAAADLAMFNLDDVALAGAAAHDPLAALVLCAAPRAERVYVAGRAVVQDGRIAALDERALAAEFNALVATRFAAAGRGGRGPAA